MAQYDLPLDELHRYRPDVERPDDFDAFWDRHLAASRSHDLDVRIERVDGVVRSVDVFDVGFSGYAGSRVAAWLFVPKELADDTPMVVEFIGYNGGRGRPLDWLVWSSAGFPHLVVDSRGQGGGWRRGDTADVGNPGEAGGRTYLTSGLSAPEQHYYGRLFVDAARATEVPGALEAGAGRPVATAGASQGGALAIAAASLGDAAFVLPDVPFLAHFRRAVALTDAAPYSEVADYCRAYPERTEQVFRTLSYFDVVNHARQVSAPALYSVGLTDLITPPSTVFAAFHHHAGEHDIEVYPYNGHEGGGTLHAERKIGWLRSRSATG